MTPAEALDVLRQSTHEDRTVDGALAVLRQLVDTGTYEETVGPACGFCLYLIEGEAEPAITVLGGTAVCQDHLGYAHDVAVNIAIQRERTGS